MSRFKVGDMVRHEDRGDGVVVESGLAFEGSPTVAVEYEDGSLLGETEDDLTSSPSVPDVDGNPIVVGQLVEHRDDANQVRRVSEIAPRAPGSWSGLRFHEHPPWDCSDHWRIVTETILTPEPEERETRDVELRVTIEVGRDLSNADLASDVRELIYQGGSGSVDADWAGCTVEVVE